MVLIGDIEYKVVVISLRDSERRKTLQERLKKGGIDEYEVIDAQIPHPSNDEFIEQLAHGKFWRNDARLKNLSKMASRKACYISHVSNVLYEFGELPLLILEDDIEIITPEFIEDTKLSTHGHAIFTRQVTLTRQAILTRQAMKC